MEMERTMRQSRIRNPKPVLSLAEASEILEKRARALAKLPPNEAAAGEMLRLVAFCVGEERYGVEIGLVQEVQPLSHHTWSPVPCTPDFIVGAVNVRGHIYSLMDVARFLGVPPRPLSEAARILLVRGRDLGTGEEMELGILADGLPQVASVRLAEIQPPGATISSRMQEYVRGVTKDMLIILNLERLLADPSIIICEEV
jgi:purine-binding chemotaxis protein CheW